MKRLIGLLTVAGMVAAASICTAVAGDGEGKRPEGGKREAKAGGQRERPEGGQREAKAGGGQRERPELLDLSVSGKVSKEQRTMKDGKTVDGYVLTDAAGNKILLGGGERRGKQAPAVPVKLEDYVGKDVTITGKGFKHEREGKSMTRIVEIIKVEAAAAAE